MDAQYCLHGLSQQVNHWNCLKNKLVVFLTIGFSVFFLIFIIRLTDDISNSHNNFLKSPNVIDVSNTIKTKVLVTKENLPAESIWSQKQFNDSNWLDIKIPEYQIVSHPEYGEHNFAYYRIFVPKDAFQKISHLQYETSLSLHHIHFHHLEILVNGKLYRANKPTNTKEAVISVPVIEGQDNIVAIKGYIKTGDTGIDHRHEILLGRGAELNELSTFIYKATTVFPLIFILSKGSILFVFALMYLLLKVEKYFEEFLIFGLCTLLEEFIAGDYLFGPLNFNQMVYVYNFANLIGLISLTLFFAEFIKKDFSKIKVQLGTLLLALLSTAVAMDALYWNAFFNLTAFMKLWNLAMVGIMIYFLPKFLKMDRIFSIVILICISLYLWSALISSNVGLNMKAYGNLLLFFMVAYQTLAIFKKEQEQLSIQEKRLLEQEKDVAIGRTASLLAHDVRKPMELMKIVIDKISTGEFDNNFLNIAKKDMDFSIASVTSQVNDIMNYGKSSSIILSEISFYRVLAGSIKQVMTIHQNLNIDLEYDFKTNHKICGEEGRLSSAIVNLISNAIEAIHEIGGKTNGVIKFSTEEQNNKFVFKIYNDGPSIPEDVLKNIFKPLYTYGKSKGTGLGLSSVSKTILEHNGEITVLNSGANGVEFVLSFPLSSALDVIQIQDFLPSSKSYLYVVPKIENREEIPFLRLFILDDDIQVIHYIESLISKIPYNIDLKFATDYENAVDLIKSYRFDLYLIDEELRSSHTGKDFYLEHLSFLSTEVILLLSSDTNDLSNLKCTKILKPISVDDLFKSCELVNAARLKVLLVDDTKLIRYAWQNYHGNHNIQTVSSPEEALKLLSSNSSNFDVCVLDYYFENSSMNGEDLAKRILEIRSDIKILIASSIDQGLKDFRSISKRDYEIRRILK